MAVLQRLTNAARVVPATVRFVDIAGLVRGASSGEGLGNAFLSHIRETNAIAMVVRCFEDDEITHVEGALDPRRDCEIIGIELASPTSLRCASGFPRSSATCAPTPSCASISRPPSASRRLWRRPARPVLRLRLARSAGRADSFLLTSKPVLFVANVEEGQIGLDSPNVEIVRAIAREEGGRTVVLSGKVEAELAGLSEAEAAEFRDELGIERSGLDELAARLTSCSAS